MKSIKISQDEFMVPKTNKSEPIRAEGGKQDKTNVNLSGLFKKVEVFDNNKK